MSCYITGSSYLYLLLLHTKHPFLRISVQLLNFLSILSLKMKRLSRFLSGNSDNAEEPLLTENKWIVEERSIDEARPLRVVIIGSGISGIIASIRFRQRIPNVDLCVYEKNADIGGTWLENRYPGCACGM